MADSDYVYVDQPEGPPKRVGWFFTSRQRYEDTNEPYLRGAWCTVEHIEAPSQSARVAAVEVTR